MPANTLTPDAQAAVLGITYTFFRDCKYRTGMVELCSDIGIGPGLPDRATYRRIEEVAAYVDLGWLEGNRTVQHIYGEAHKRLTEGRYL